MHIDIKNATNILKKGGLILFPEETGWGVACDATNQQATEKFMKLYNRDKPLELELLLENPARIERYVTEVPEITWDLVEVSLKPLTIILPGAKNLAPGIADSEGNIAIRICRDDFCVALLQRFRRPLLFFTATKNNHDPAETFEDICQEITDVADYTTQYKKSDIIPATKPAVIKLWPGGRIDIIRN